MDDFSPGRRSPRGASREVADRRRGSPRWPSRDREQRRSPRRSSLSRARGEDSSPSRGGVRREGASPEPKSGRGLPRANGVERDDELASRRPASGRRDSREGAGRDRRPSRQRDARGPLSPPYGPQRRFERRSPSPYRGGDREARPRGENERKRGRSRESSEGGRQVRRESRRLEEGDEGGSSHFGYRGDDSRRDEPRGDRGGRGGENRRREDPGRSVLSERDEEFAGRDDGAGRDREARETDERDSSLSRPLPRDKCSREDSSERREDRQGSRRGTVAPLEDRSRRRVSRSPGQGRERQERGSLSSFYSVREREGREEREAKDEGGSEKLDEPPRGERKGGSVAEVSRRAEGEKDRFSGGREEICRRRESHTRRRRLSSDSRRLPETGRDRSSDSIGERERRSPPRAKDSRDETRREDDSGRGDSPLVGRRERSGSPQKNAARRSASLEEERTKTRRDRVSSLSPETDKGEPASVSFQEGGRKPPRRLPLPPPPLVSRGGRGERDGEEDTAGPRPRRESEDNSRGEDHKRVEDRNRDDAPQSPVAARRRQTSFCLRIENLPSSPSRSEIGDLLRDCCGIRVPIDMVELFPADARAVVHLQSQQQAESAQYRLHRRSLRNCRLDVFLGDRVSGRDSRDDNFSRRDRGREDSRGSRSPRRRGASPGRGEEARERRASPGGSSFRILRPRSPPGPTGDRASSPVRRGRRSPPRPLIIRPGPSGGAFPGGIEVLPTDFARGDRRRDEDDERRGQRGADRRGYGRGSLSPRGRSACGARESGSSRSPKRRRRDEDLSSDSRRRRASRSLSRSPMNGEDKGAGPGRRRARDDRSASREGRKASVSQSSRPGRDAGEKEKGEKGSSLSPEGRGGRLSSSRPYPGPEETSREPKTGAGSNLGPRPRSRSPPQGGSRRFMGLGGPHGSTPGISIRLAGRGGPSRDYMDGRGPGSGGRGRSPSPHSRRRGGSPRRGWRPPAPRFGLGSVSRSRSRASHSLTASEKSDRRERDEDTKGEKRRDSVGDGKARRRSLSRRSQEREGGARSGSEERAKARGPSPLNRERASDAPCGERRQERDRSSGRPAAERRDRSVKQNPQEKAMLRLHERGRCTPCRQIIKGLECFRISTCPYCHHAEHDPMYNRPGVEEPELEATSLLSLASAGLHALRDGVDAGAGQQGEEESRPRGRSTSLSPSGKAQTKPGGGNSALSPMVLKQHLAGTCLPCSEYKQDRCRRGDSCPFCHHSDHLPKGEKAKGEPKKKEAKKLDSKEQQERYALERHEKGWCRPCKKYFAKNAECPAVKKNQPCLYCHHEDHRDDMPSRIQSRQPSPERASPPSEPLKVEEAPPQDTSAPLLASPPHSLHSPSSLCSPTAQGAMGEQGTAGPAILRPGDPATRAENFVFADPAQQRKHEKGLCLPCKFYVSGRQCYKADQGCVYCHHPSHLSLAVQGLSQHADGTGLPCLQKVREQHEQGVCRPCVHHFVPGLTCAWGVQCLLCHHPQHGDRSSPSFYLKWEHDRNVCLPCAKAHVSGHGGCPESDNCGYCHDPVHSDPTSELHFARVLHARGVCRPCQQFLQGTCTLEQLCCPFCHNPQHLGGFAAEKEGERERGPEGTGPPGRGAVVPVPKIGPATPPGHALFMRPPGTDGRTAPGLPFPPQQPAGNVPLPHPGLPGPPMGHPPPLAGVGQPLAHPAGVGAAGMFPGPPHHPVRPAFVYGGVPPPSGTAVAGSPFPGQPPLFAGAGAGAAPPGSPTNPQKEEREGTGDAGPGEGVKESLGLQVGVIAAPPMLGGAPKEEEQGAKEEEELDPVAAAAAAYAKEQEARQVLLQNQSVMQATQSMAGSSPPGGSPWGVPYMQPPPPGAAPWGAPGAPHGPSGSMPAGSPQGPHPIGVGPPPPGPPGTGARSSHLLPTPPGAPGAPLPGSRPQAQMGPPLAIGGDRAMPSMPGAPPPGAAPPAPMYGMTPAMGRPPAPAQAPGSFCGPIGSPAGIRPPQGPPGVVGTSGPPGYMGSESSFGVSHLAPGQRPAPPHPHGSPAPFASPSAQKPSPPPLMGWGAQPLVASQPPPPGAHLTSQGDAGQGVGLAGPPPGMSPAMGTGAPPPPPPPPSGSPSEGFGDSSTQASGSSFQASLAAKNPAAAAMLEAAQQAAQAAASKIGSSNSSPPPPPTQSFLNQSSRVPGMSPAAAAAAAAAAALAAAAMAARKKGEEAQKVRDMEQPQGSKPSQAMAGLPVGHAAVGTPLPSPLGLGRPSALGSTGLAPSPFGFSVGSRSGGLASVVEAAKAAVAQKALLAAREAQEAPIAAPENPQNLPAGVLAAAEAAKAAAAAISASLAGVGGFTG